MDHDMTSASRQRLADYLYDLAAWRQQRTAQHPGDEDDRGVEGLRTLARHITRLDNDDERLYVLAALDVDLAEAFQPGHEADRLTRNYLVDLRNESPDAWFSRFIDALARERGDQGGRDDGGRDDGDPQRASGPPDTGGT